MATANAAPSFDVSGMTSYYINTGCQDMIYRAKIAAQMVSGGHRTGVNAIIFSAIAAEAFPNDFVGWCTPIMAFKQKYEKHIAASVQLLRQAESDRMQVKTKYQMMYYALCGEPIETGNKPYQDFALLIDLRNDLVHHKVDVVETKSNSLLHENRIKKLFSSLIQRKLLIRKEDQMPCDWKIVIDESPAVAHWAVASAQAIISEMIKKLPEGEIRTMYRRSSILKSTLH